MRSRAAKVCKFKLVNSPSNFEEVSFDQVLSIIKDDKSLKEQIESLRQADVDSYGKYKLALPAFSVSTTFNTIRSNEDVKDYNGIIHLDYDHVSDPEALKEKLAELSFVYAAFISPSGEGVKVFVKTNSSMDTHLAYFNGVRDICDTVVGSDSDKSVKDVARLCFLSHDPNLYINSDAEVFDISLLETNEEIIETPTLDWVFDFTSNRQSFLNGSRNVFTFLFACNSNRFGIEKEDALDYMLQYSEPGFKEDEIKRTILGAYNRYAYQFAELQYCRTATLESSGAIQSEIISNDIYDNLPEVLKTACKHFSERERDVFFISALTVLSGYFNNVKGVYDGKIIYPNLYSFIVANAASGKSAAKYAKAFGKTHHDALTKTTQEAMTSYALAKSQYEKAKKSKGADGLKEPVKPKNKVFFFPGDSSEASLVSLIADNDGKGCIFETEADTISGANKQEWGGFSHILRKNFHHEDISRSRKTDDEYTEIQDPRFSFLTTGTPDQVIRLIPSAEDGLYSRFLFYCFEIPYEWRSVYTMEITDSVDVIIDEIGKEFSNGNKNKEPRTFNITKTQGDRLNETFRAKLEELKIEQNDTAVSVLFRHGLMVYKIAMVLSILNSKDKDIICADLYFDISLSLVTHVFYENSYQLLKKMGGKTVKTSSYKVVYEFLPDSFTRKQAVQVFKKAGLKERSTDAYLVKMANDGLIAKKAHGAYEKL